MNFEKKFYGLIVMPTGWGVFENVNIPEKRSASDDMPTVFTLVFQSYKSLITHRKNLAFHRDLPLYFSPGSGNLQYARKEIPVC
jgi:hypothetical protein